MQKSPPSLSDRLFSTSLALASINLARTWFAWRSFGWQPFGRTVLYLLALPGFNNIWLTLLLRGGVLTVLCGAGLLLSGWVPEVNAVAQRLGLKQ